MSEKYPGYINNSIYNSPVYTSETKFKETDDSMRKTPEVTFENLDTVSALYKHKDSPRIAVLNFASFKHPGGGFVDGSMAQEEALCHESDLYNVLCKFTEFYKYNNENLNQGMYSNRAIYCRNVLFSRNGYVTFADVITVASPNKIPAIRYKSFSNAENHAALKSRIEFIRDIAENENVDTLILGAFGCGVFLQDPEEVADLFKETFRETTVKRIVYAVPGNDRNAEVFSEVFG